MAQFGITICYTHDPHSLQDWAYESCFFSRIGLGFRAQSLRWKLCCSSPDSHLACAWSRGMCCGERGGRSEITLAEKLQHRQCCTTWRLEQGSHCIRENRCHGMDLPPEQRTPSLPAPFTKTNRTARRMWIVHRMVITSRGFYGKFLRKEQSADH